MRQPPLILIADDNEANRDILARRLEAHGYQLAMAADGEEALRSARALLPDLILLDVMMPKIDGLEVCRRLKADKSLPFIPIILVTARSDTKDVVAGLDRRRRRIPDQAGRPGRAGCARALDPARQGAARHRARAGQAACRAIGRARPVEPHARSSASPSSWPKSSAWTV